MDKQLTATEKFSWLLISLLPELSIIIYLNLKMQDEILSNVITGLIIFAVITIFNILIYIVLKVALMIYSYLKLKKIKEEIPDEVKQKDVRNIFLIKIDLLYVALLAALLMLGLLVKVFIDSGRKIYLLIAVFIISFIVYSFSTEFIFEKVLEPHQKIRIETLLGLKEDPKGAEWNTNQSKIAISSGGLWGKGFLKGTQTKLKFVPEQDTDFIFCTIAEEWGFVGSIVVVSMFFIFIYRILFLSERQSNIFARVYGYSVAGIFIFHVIINIGMVVGIVPVIGIPLPFFSYGGSSLLAFTILLFIFIKLDMGNKVNI